MYLPGLRKSGTSYTKKYIQIFSDLRSNLYSWRFSLLT
nr:MAG TPA: hypothetical protein [Caudoviricetes sp.]